MSILVQEVVNRASAALDAEGSERYLFNQDYKPAINYSIEWMISAFNAGFSENKLSGEALRELVKIGVWQASSFSRIVFDPAIVGHSLWTVLAIYPDIKVHPFSAPVPNPDPVASTYKPGVSYVSGKASTNRLTLEEWNDNQDNVFMPGNNVLGAPLVEFAYLDFADYQSTGYVVAGGPELEIRPSVANKFVALGYLKRPSAVASITDSLPFPDSMTNLIVEKALSYISYKQGDGTTLYEVTARDIQQLASLLL